MKTSLAYFVEHPVTGQRLDGGEWVLAARPHTTFDTLQEAVATAEQHGGHLGVTIAYHLQCAPKANQIEITATINTRATL